MVTCLIRILAALVGIAVIYFCAQTGVGNDPVPDRKEAWRKENDL